MNRNYTICVVGFCTGKSSLITRFVKPKAKWETIQADVGNDPTDTASQHHTQLTANGTIINVTILDTNGLEPYKEYREEAIAKSHGILLCYSICYRNTFEQLYRFVSEIIAVKGSLNTPMMLVGTMYDRESERTVLPEEAHDLADFLGAKSTETSSKMGTHVTDAVFNLMKEILRMERRQTANQISLSTSSQSVGSGVDLVAPQSPDAELKKKKKKRTDSKKGENLYKSMMTQPGQTTEITPTAHMTQMGTDMKESNTTKKVVLKEWINLLGLDSASYRFLKKASVKSLGDVRFVCSEDLTLFTRKEDWQPVSRDKFLHYTAEDSDIVFLLDLGITNPFFPIWHLNGKRLKDSSLARIVKIITTWKYRVTGLNLQDNEISDLNLIVKLLQNNKDLVLLNISNNPFKVSFSELVPFLEAWKNMFRQNDVLHYLLVWNTRTYFSSIGAFGELRRHVRAINRKHIKICAYQWEVQFVAGLSELLHLVESHIPSKADTNITVPQDAPIETWIEVHRLKHASKVLVKNAGVKFVKDLRFVKAAQLEELTPFLRNKVWYLIQVVAGVIPKGHRWDITAPQPGTPVGTLYKVMPGPETNNDVAPSQSSDPPVTIQPIVITRSRSDSPTTQRPNRAVTSPVATTQPVAQPVTQLVNSASADVLPVAQPSPQASPQVSPKNPERPVEQSSQSTSSTKSDLAEIPFPSPTTARIRAASASSTGRKQHVGEDINITNLDNECLINYAELHFEQILGTGSYGVVYQALYRYQAVAVKQLHAYNFKSYINGKNDSENGENNLETPKFKLTQEEMDQFYHEAELMKNLRPHANVVLFLGICCEPPCIVTEFLPGGTLESLLKNLSVTLSLTTILNYALDTAAGLNHLHRENIIHRDLATRNLLLTDTARVKIADFGMSRFVNSNAGQTRSNTGPLRWMSPESLVDRTYSKHSDMWGFGCVMIELLTRDVPFPHLSPLEAAYQVAFQSAKPIVPDFHSEGTVKVPVPPALKTIIQECFDQTPELRPNADVMCSRLLHLKQQLTPRAIDIKEETVSNSTSSSAEPVPESPSQEVWTAIPQRPVLKKQSSLILSSIKVQVPPSQQAEIDRKRVEEELEDVINYLLDS